MKEAEAEAVAAKAPGPVLALFAIRYARLDRHEIAGSLGDMRTFLPLLLGMASQNGLDFATALFFDGVFNVVPGCVFPIPVAVQPMKAIAAVAITERLTVPQIVAAAAWVSAVVLALGVTSLIGWVNRAVPRSVVRGLQLALGFSLGGPAWCLPGGPVPCASLEPPGSQLSFSGIELALVTRDRTDRTSAFTMLLTAGACLGLDNMALGFAIGLSLALLLRLRPFRVESP